MRLVLVSKIRNSARAGTMTDAAQSFPEMCIMWSVQQVLNKLVLSDGLEDENCPFLPY